MNNEITLIRKPSDRCFEETMKREAKADDNNNVSTNLPNLIRATFSDYCTDDQRENSNLMLRMYQYCITEFKSKRSFSMIKHIAEDVMEYDKEYIENLTV